MSDNERLQSPTQTPPDFIDLQEKEREEFLSQLGNFSPQERTIFHQLCKHWQPEMSYNQIVSKLDVHNPGSELINLMNKLKKQRVGFVSYRTVEGVQKPDKVILTYRDSPLFYRKAVEEFYTKLQETMAAPLPYESEVLEQYPQLPKEDIHTIDYATLLRMTAGDAEAFPAVYRIPVRDGDALLATPISGKWVIHATIGKLRAFFSNPDYLELAARLQDTSLQEIKQRLGSRNPDFWKNLTGSLLRNEASVVGNRSLRVGKRFFQICDFIYNYVQSQIELAEEQKRQREDRELDMKSIAQSVRDDPDKVVSDGQLQERLTSFADSYGKKFADFKAEFWSRYTSTSNISAPLINLDNDWIHVDNLFPVFASRLTQLQPQLRKHYVKEMTRQLRTNNRSHSEVFYSKENFEQDIYRTIEEMDPLLARCLENPNLISEALVHNLKKRRQIQSPEELRAHLMVYFRAKTLQFLPLAEMFNLNLGEIFHSSFTALPLWRQIVIRLLGRYAALEEKFIGRSFTGYQRLMREEMRDRNELKPKKASELAEKLTRDARPQRTQPDSDQSHRQKSSGKKATIKKAKKRGYNATEREEAWRRFGETIKK